MPSGDGPPLSLRPYPVADQKPKNVAEFIARVNTQPGGFRVVTEKKLEEEIVAANGEAHDGQGRDEEMISETEEGDEEEGGDNATKDPGQARIEVLKNMDVAGNTAMLILDSVSLLLSKQSPTQAGVTLSQQLRDMVGIGTIGADKLDKSNVIAAKVKDGEDVAVGWTLMELNKTRDSAEEAAEFLRREMDAEGKYWEGVVQVHNAGWSVCRMPQERHTLGVRFGFSEATPEFRNNGLAPLRRDERGSVELDCGKLGGVSERLLVTYEKNGKVVGRSALAAETAGDAPLQAQVLEARNTIFAQELWYELSRESRSLLAYDVKPDGSRLLCEIDATSRIVLELVPLRETSQIDESLPENKIAEGISAALHIFLSYAHRYNELMRIRPLPPHIPRSRGQQSYALFRPIIARVRSIRSIQTCTTYVGELVASLKKAGLPSSFTLSTVQSAISDATSRGPNKLSAAQILVRNMLQPLEFHTHVVILPNINFTIRGRTILYPVTTTFYHILTPPSSPLQEICAPFKDGYADFTGLSSYLCTATSRILTEHMLTKLHSEPSRKAAWVQSVSGMAIRHADRDDVEVRFAVEQSPPVLVVWLTSNIGKGPIGNKMFRWDGNTVDEKTVEELVDELAEARVFKLV